MPEYLVKTAAGLLGALVSAAGLIAVGGAVQWARFEAADLPADQAVAALAREELIVAGAAALALFIVAGLTVVLIAYVVDPDGCFGWPAAAVLAAAAVVGLVYALVGTEITAGGLLVLLIVAAGLVALDLGIAKRTGDRFVWFGCAVFVSVVAFASALALLRSFSAPEVQAVALLRGPTDRGLSGIYVARNDKRLYVGRPGERALYVYPCQEVTALAVGPLRKPTDAEAEGGPLRVALLEARSRALGIDVPTADKEAVEREAPTAKEAARPPGASIC